MSAYDEAGLLAALSARAPLYDPRLGPAPVPVAVLRVAARRQSTLFFLALGTREHTLPCVVKLGGRAAVTDRPRLAPVAGDRHRFEHGSLHLMFEALSAAPVSGVGAVRPLDHLPEWRAIVTELAEGASLRRMLEPSWKRPLPIPDPTALVERAGAWLAVFHRLDSPEARPRLEAKANLLALATDLTRYISQATGDTRLLAQIEAAALARIDSYVPDRLPLGLAHGDFAPRNLVVGPDSRVSGLDPLGCWRAPVYEDLAYFVLWLRTSGARALSRGLLPGDRLLARWEAAFLAGYGAPAGTTAALAAFELLVLLDRWAALVGRATRQGPVGWPSRAHLFAVRRSLRYEAERMLHRRRGAG